MPAPILIPRFSPSHRALEDCICNSIRTIRSQSKHHSKDMCYPNRNPSHVPIKGSNGEILLTILSTEGYLLIYYLVTILSMVDYTIENPRYDMAILEYPQNETHYENPHTTLLCLMTTHQYYTVCNILSYSIQYLQTNCNKLHIRRCILSNHSLWMQKFTGNVLIIRYCR